MTSEEKRLVVSNLLLTIDYLKDKDQNILSNVQETLEILKTNWDRDDYYYIEMLKSLNNN
jgi:hypothetical protein